MIKILGFVKNVKLGTSGRTVMFVQVIAKVIFATKQMETALTDAQIFFSDPSVTEGAQMVVYLRRVATVAVGILGNVHLDVKMGSTVKVAKTAARQIVRIPHAKEVAATVPMSVLTKNCMDQNVT